MVEGRESGWETTFGVGTSITKDAAQMVQGTLYFGNTCPRVHAATVVAGYYPIRHVSFDGRRKGPPGGTWCWYLILLMTAGRPPHGRWVRASLLSRPDGTGLLLHHRRHHMVSPPSRRVSFRATCQFTYRWPQISCRQFFFFRIFIELRI